MSSVQTARAVLEMEQNGIPCIITIKRTKYKEGKEVKVYYTFPGGHVEENESFEETLHREIQEELGINVTIKSKFFQMHNDDLNRDETFYICLYQNGELGTGTGPEWSNPDIEKYGKYEIMAIPISNVLEYPLYPKEVVIALHEYYRTKYESK